MRNINYRHTEEELKLLQSLPLELKIAKTKLRIREWVEHFGEDGVVLSFSGGKDSTVLKHIIDGMGYNIQSVFVNTGLEHQEVQRFVRQVKKGQFPCFNSNVLIVRPKMQFKDVLSTYGYPIISKDVAEMIYYARKNSEWALLKLKGLNRDGTPCYFKEKLYTKWNYLTEAPFAISHFCCLQMKEKPLRDYQNETKKNPFVATLADESIRRKHAWRKTGCNAFDSNKKISKPLSFWTEQDIYHYISKFNVPIASVYGEVVSASKENQVSVEDITGNFEENQKLRLTGLDRTGCIFCMFGCHLEKQPNRFQRLKETHPRQYEYCIGGGEFVDGKWMPNEEGLGLGFVLDYLGVPYK